MPITGKPNLVIPIQKRKLTPLAASYADRALTAKYDYLLHQAAACAFIGLSDPKRAERDIVQKYPNARPRPVDDTYLDYGAFIDDLKDDALKIATKEEWQLRLDTMEMSALLTHEHDDNLPVEDLHLGTFIRRQIKNYQTHRVERSDAVHNLVAEAKRYLNIYHQEMRLFLQEVRKSHSEGWINKVLLDLFLTKGETRVPRKGRKDRAKKIIWATNESVTPFGKERMVKGKFRKPLKKAVVAAALFTAFAGVAYIM